MRDQCRRKLNLDPKVNIALHGIVAPDRFVMVASCCLREECNAVEWLRYAFVSVGASILLKQTSRLNKNEWRVLTAYGPVQLSVICVWLLYTESSCFFLFSHPFPFGNFWCFHVYMSICCKWHPFVLQVVLSCRFLILLLPPLLAVQAGRGQVPAPLRVFRGGLPRCIPHSRRLGRSGAWGESWYGSHVTALNLPSYCCRWLVSWAW